MSLPDASRPATQETLRVMRDLVREYKKNDAVRQKAVDLTKYLEAKNWLAEVQALWAFVKNNVRYVRDISGVETIYTPDVTLQNLSGDCDDKAVLLASMLESIGHPTRFVAVGFSPGVFSHVYPETLIGNDWTALETTEEVPMGWAPRGAVERYVLRN